MVVIMVICYLLCWLPYGVVALMATFGPPHLVTPEASIIPSILAKSSTVINPVIYVFMNKQVGLWNTWKTETEQQLIPREESRVFPQVCPSLENGKYFRTGITSVIHFVMS